MCGLIDGIALNYSVLVNLSLLSLAFICTVYLTELKKKMHVPELWP